MSTVGPANTEQEARTSWTSRYPFEPFGSGQGASITCSSSSTRTALVGTTSQVNCALICNTGAVWAFVLLGDSSVNATTANMAIPPGACSLISLSTQGQAVPTHIAGVTASGTATLQVTLGYGGN